MTTMITIGIISFALTIAMMLATFITAHKNSEWMDKHGIICFILIGLFGIIASGTFLIAKDYILIKLVSLL